MTYSYSYVLSPADAKVIQELFHSHADGERDVSEKQMNRISKNSVRYQDAIHFNFY